MWLPRSLWKEEEKGEGCAPSSSHPGKGSHRSSPIGENKSHDHRAAKQAGKCSSRLRSPSQQPRETQPNWENVRPQMKTRALLLRAKEINHWSGPQFPQVYNTKSCWTKLSRLKELRVGQAGGTEWTTHRLCDIGQVSKVSGSLRNPPEVLQGSARRSGRTVGPQ